MQYAVFVYILPTMSREARSAIGLLIMTMKTPVFKHQHCSAVRKVLGLFQQLGSSGPGSNTVCL